ncbi:MAG: type II toxin-antitoxin system VapC family toxin [Rhizomicrobium sp.]|jgi:predicted nucleic acid-binding protein
MIVVDSSLAVELLLPTPLGVRIVDRVFDEERHVPHLIDVEFASALRRLTRFGGLNEAAARRALDNFGDWTLVRHDHGKLLQRIWQLRDSVSAYDAAYVALAESLDAPLLTCDAKLSRAHGHRARIELLN